MSASRENDADPRIGYNTSDHTYQSARVVLVDAQDQPLLAVKGCTWNLMNYGVSLKTNGTHPNNPWDFDEDHTSYMIRKKRQLDKILTIIITASAADENDFFFLQEVDIFFPAHPKLNVTELQQAERNELITEFDNKLQALGWKIISKKGGLTQQALVTLFNTKILQINGAATSVFPTTKKQCRGLAQEFIHLTTHQSVALVNLHLDYSIDYSQSIPEYQRHQAKEGKFTVMGGDTNHAPNQGIVGLINTWSNITNLAGDLNGIAYLHKNTAHIMKCYDGFFANPTQDPVNPLNHTSVHITEQAAEVFKIVGAYKVDGRNTFVVAALPANPHVHRSAPGEPWRRGGYSEHLESKAVANPANRPQYSSGHPQQSSIPPHRDAFFAAPVPLIHNEPAYTLLNEQELFEEIPRDTCNP